ncbi:uncharacterized protein FOKN1_2225 [Thiohalobacter thiocyanaticus]|uniref:Uncharacterized protein n=1 Tax=Thiohalobacter thiocyanaticus TaxID=585455 RepID=A0A1Z4VT69_9GAMM|nr:uncharacterized protein FOKN1_2225 [Thiohalobacter thiocyanaticus]
MIRLDPLKGVGDKTQSLSFVTDPFKGGETRKESEQLPRELGLAGLGKGGGGQQLFESGGQAFDHGRGPAVN